jgi:phenylalanyl-tRNA synthetase beta chain
MGGLISEVSDDTTRVLMEAATWVGPNILRTSLLLGLRSEASARFEKQLHPEQAMAAQRLAARLMVDLCGARMVPGTIDAYPGPAEPRTVRLRLSRLSKLLGEEVPPDDVRAILERLGFDVAEQDGELSAVVPSWRDSDVQREADLIEEVARIHGLDKLPTTLPARRRAVGRLTPEQRLRRRLEDALRDRGLTEIIAWSFTSAEALARLRLAGEPALDIANPLSEDQSVMRPLLLPGLLDAAAHNSAHDRPELAVFESAHVYRPGASAEGVSVGSSPGGIEPAVEHHRLGVLVTQAEPGSWRSEPRPADFYAARALLEAVLESAAVSWRPEPATLPFLHPGRSALVVGEGDRELGWIGELHPSVTAEWELPQAAAAFELDLDAVAELVPDAPQYHDVTGFPAVVQDIAVVVPEDVPAAEVERAVREGAGELLVETRIFDLYRGEQVGEESKSLALRLEFRAPDRTLTDEEVAERRAAIERALAEIGGKLRA